jgi:hypothetical protein
VHAFWFLSLLDVLRARVRFLRVFCLVASCKVTSVALHDWIFSGRAEQISGRSSFFMHAASALGTHFPYALLPLLYNIRHHLPACGSYLHQFGFSL